MCQAEETQQHLRDSTDGYEVIFQLPQRRALLLVLCNETNGKERTGVAFGISKSQVLFRPSVANLNGVAFGISG